VTANPEMDFAGPSAAGVMTAEPQGRLLIVDDETAHMRALCRTLEVEGYATTGFGSSRQALAAIQPGAFDLLLTDLMMPEMDGIALLRAARQIDSDLVGVVMTGHATIDTAVDAMKVGALDYIQKPFRLTLVLPVIVRALDVRRLRIENVRLLDRERQHVEALKAANRDLESFSFSVSHDLRAPLRAVTGFCEIYLERFGGEVTAEGRRILDQVVSGAQRMDHLIADLLQFSRFSRQPLVRTKFELDPLVRRVAAQVESQYLERQPQRQVEVKIGALPVCDGDASLIEQVFVNLLSNAFKFTGREPTARIEIGREGDTLFVRDNGAGFDMQYADKLFGVFQRLHSLDEFEGTGVGLSIVKRIIERHGGRIWAESRPGSGATFYFTLAPGAAPGAVAR